MDAPALISILNRYFTIFDIRTPVIFLFLEKKYSEPYIQSVHLVRSSKTSLYNLKIFGYIQSVPILLYWHQHQFLKQKPTFFLLLFRIDR